MNDVRRVSARKLVSPLLALLLHGIAFVALTLGKPPAKELLPSVGTDELPVELAVEPAPSLAVHAPVDPPTPTAARATEAPTGRVATATTSSIDSSEPHEETAATSGASENVAPPSPVLTVRPAPIDIGLGGTNRFMPRSAEAVERAEAQRSVNEALRSASVERDRVLGLGPEGPVLTALADGTSRSVAPIRGRAVFVASTNAAGEVIAIDLEDAEGGRPGWADAARIALAELKGKKLRMPPGTTRAVMKIEVVSAWKLPSGQDPGSDVTLFHIPVAKGEGKDSPKVSILDPIPKIRVDYLEPSPGVKIPVPSVSLDIFSATNDPSNLGAKARRVIHTHVLDTKVM
jgi:hypothetical protein